MIAEKFWNEYGEKKGRLHICEIPKEVFYARHKHVLSLIGKYDYCDIGILIAGTYYRDVWASRSCSGYLSQLLGHDDYMDFYCASSLYYTMEKGQNEKLIEDFNREKEKDGSSV